MRAEHVEELWISHALPVSDFIFQHTNPVHKQDRIEDDGRTLKVYNPNCTTGNYLNLIDIYSGHTISFKPKLDSEHEGQCTKLHVPPKSHLPILDLEFERFGFFGVVLFSVCQTGIYLSTATLNKNTCTVKIDPENRVLVHSDHTFWQIQLLRIDDQTGIAVYNHNRTTIPDKGHTLQTFRLTSTGKIQLSVRRFVGMGLIYRIFPLILHGHLYYFSRHGDLIDYDYSNGTFILEEGLIPTIKDKDQCAWYGSRFYFLYELDSKQRTDTKHYEFGVFNMETKRFSILHLPDSIPANWMERIYKIFTFSPFMFIDERAVLNILPLNMKEWGKCSHVEKVTEYLPCPVRLFRIPLRLPETLSNLTYFSFLKKPAHFQQEFESLVQSLYPGHSGQIKYSAAE